MPVGKTLGYAPVMDALRHALAKYGETHKVRSRNGLSNVENIVCVSAKEVHKAHLELTGQSEGKAASVSTFRRYLNTTGRKNWSNVRISHSPAYGRTYYWLDE